MNAVTSLLDFILNLLKNPQAQAEFRASPEQVLAAHGLTGVCAADIHEALPLVTDHRSVELTTTSHSAQPSVGPALGDGYTHAAIEYLRYITNTYTYEDHSVHIDESVRGNIWAVGDVAQTFDDSHVVRDGLGPVAGGHIPGPVMPGPSSAVGTGTWVGDGRLHSFGAGATTTLASGIESPAACSGDVGGSHGNTGFDTPTEPGNAARRAGPDDCGHTHDAHSSLGDSYYSQSGEHGVYDVHDEPSLHLDLH